MANLFKFAAAADHRLLDKESASEFCHPNIWELQSFPTFRRLVIGARSDEVALILELCRSLKGPFYPLIILRDPQSGLLPGRYETEDCLTHNQLWELLYPFRALFEQDGRADLWVISQSGEGQFIFDCHNIIYAYGDLDATKNRLKNLGFNEGQIDIPYPHAHYCHKELTRLEEQLFAMPGWLRSDLREADDEEPFTPERKPKSNPNYS